MSEPSPISLVRIAPDVVLGLGVKLNPFVNLYGCTIGDDCMIGTFVEIQRGASLGARCRIQSHTFICTGVSLADDVFVGHGVMFINDRHPTAQSAREGTWKQANIVVHQGASLGSGAVIMGGVTIGAGAMIGAGAVVLHDVAPGETVVGIPARALLVRPGRQSTQ